ncbi:MAG: transposase [bacterium]|nr:transposase [bacterium]
MMRKEKLVAGNRYHVYNRGVRSEPIFLENSDRTRFLFLLLYCQLPFPLSNNEYHSNLFEKHGSFYLHANREQINAALPHRHVELESFCLMPNHFHVSMLAREDTGVSKYMQRVLNAYTKYFNIKHKKTGHLFEGPFKAVRVESSEELLYLSAYIHRNPRELREWRNKEAEYPFSSLLDYTSENRWGDLLMSKTILKHFKDEEEYKSFVEKSSSKTIESKLSEEHLFED